MNPTVEYSLVILLGYLLGSISFAVLIAKKHGINILKEGSGNPGATNVKRVIGKNAGNLVFFLDFLKGFLAAIIPMYAFTNPSNSATILAIVGLSSAIMGHSFSMFLKFKGGKGVATTIGGLIAIMPTVLLGGILVWLIVYYSSKIVSIASLVFGISLPLIAYTLQQTEVAAINNQQFLFALALAILITVRHLNNIQRLIKGKETQFK